MHDPAARVDELPSLARLVDASLRAGRLWLVRHGESTWNALALVQGQVPLPVLTARGRRQARRCAWALRGEQVDAVYASDLRRAFQTAVPIARALGLGVAVDAGLRERSLGAAEGMPASLLGPEWSGIHNGRVIDADAAPPGGESLRELYGRVSRCVSALVDRHRGANLVLVCHGGVVRMAEAWLDGVGPDALAWGPLDNGEIVGRSAPAGARRIAPLSPSL